MSCFKFKMCRKRAYNFNNQQSYEPAQSAEGTYRYSTVDVDGWDPETALQDPGTTPRATTTTTAPDKNVLASPSNSDVTFGGNFQDADESDRNNESEKDKKKKDKNKKDKSKKKSKNKKKEEDKENAVNESTEKGQEDSDSTSKEKDNADDVDISNMETLPREDRQVVGHSETTTVTTQGDKTTTSETLITEAIVTETIYERRNSSEGGHPDTQGLEQDQDHKDTSSFEGNEDVHKKDLITSDLQEDNRSDTSTTEKQTFTTTTTIIVSNDESFKRKSDMSSSGEGDPYLSPDADDVHYDAGEDHDSMKGMATPYPEPEEQIDVRNIKNLADVTSHTTEESTIRDSEDGTTLTVTKVIVTETVKVQSNDAKDSDAYEGHVE